MPIRCGRKAVTMGALRRAGPKHSPQPIVPSSQITSTTQLARVAVPVNDQANASDSWASSTWVLRSAMRIGSTLPRDRDQSREPGCTLGIDGSRRRLAAGEALDLFD